MQEKLTLEIKPSEDFKNYMQELSKDIKELIKVLKEGESYSNPSCLQLIPSVRGFGPIIDKESKE